MHSQVAWPAYYMDSVSLEASSLIATVLIVDDSKLARLILTNAIIALQPNWSRLEASNTDEAASILEREKVDVVILDFNMPGRDGLSYAEELRAQFPTLPIALVTANTQDHVAERARAINIAFIDKPLTSESLRGFLSGAALRLRASAS